MSSIEEKTDDGTTNVLTITRPTPTLARQHQVLSTIEDIDSTHSMTPPQSPSGHNEKTLEISPYSTFDNDTPARTALTSESKQNINVIHHSPYDTDIEALTPQRTQCSQSKTGLLKSKCKTNIADTAWPTPQELKQRKKALKKQDMKCCGFWVNMQKRYKVLVYLTIALMIVGLGTGLGVGLSRNVGGGVYLHGSPNAPIGS
jgi:hypothetical protein